MIFNALKPTYENILNSFKNDSIGRNKDVLAFAKILNQIDKSCTISLDGSWGSGKTFFIKQVKMIMDAHNDFIKSSVSEDKEQIKKIIQCINYNNPVDFEPQLCVYYDAWQNDSDEDPLLSLIYSIINNVDADYSQFCDKSIISIITSIAEVFTKRNWHSLLENIRGENVFEEIRYSKNIENKICDFLSNIMKEKGNRMVIFVDELDRCKPSYAVSLLERVKHYFSDERITFVFSINPQELQHTIKHYYGYEFDASRYLDRFFDLRTQMPVANVKKYYDSLNFDIDTYYDEVCKAVINTYKYSLREISRYISTTRIALKNKNNPINYPDSYRAKAITFELLNVLPIMIGLRLYDTTLYNRFISGEDASPLIDVSKALPYIDFDELLSIDESFRAEGSKREVTIDEKLNQVYKAIFNDYVSEKDYIRIGELCFNKSTKEELMNSMTLLSQYANFEYE